MLFVADEVEQEILQLKVESNGVTITATVLGKVECPRQTFGIAAIDNHVYVSSTHRSLGGIISYDYDNKQQKFTNPAEPPNRLISNGTAECKTVHGVAVLSSAEEMSKLVFTDVGAKKVKCLLLEEDVLTIEVLSGTGTGGQTDGAKATFSQPTSCCTEASTVYVTDSATGTLKMITRPSRLLKYLENLNKLLRLFGFHRRNEPRANVKTFSAKEAIDVIGQLNGFFKHCISEVRKITNLTRILQGPDGVCSQQTIWDPFYVETHCRID